MFESGFWIFVVETLGIGALFVILVWWVVRGSDASHREHAARQASAERASGDTGNEHDK